MTIKMVLILLLMQKGIAHVVNVKGAFVYRKFKGGEKVFVKVPRGFEEFYPKDTVLLLKKTLYGLKQAAKAFYRKLLAEERNIGLQQSIADPYLYTSGSDNPVDQDAASNRMARNTYLHRLPLGNKTQGILAPNDSQAFLPRGNP